MRWVAWLASLALAPAIAGTPAPGRASSPVLDAIEQLESERDAKCHSSASRFEDFLNGTPLSSEARHANVAEQKRLARRLWSDASDRARRAGRDRVGAEAVLSAGAARLPLESGGADGVRLTLPDLEVPELRARQYASIAYSLRAILAVEQDQLILGDAELLPLAPEGLESLRRVLDAASLAVLALADREARRRSDPEVTEPTLRAAWARVQPGSADAQARAPEPVAAPAAGAARERALPLFDELVEGKLAAYRAYNELSGERATRLLVFNISRFYARRPLSPLRSERRELLARLDAHLDAYAAALLAEADGLAGAEPLIRAEAADRAVQRLTPHRIDDFEDVHVFERLPPDERVTLEAFDCDSFRDFGSHWLALQRAVHAAPESARLPDPFAAEILAEAVSQYAVLLLRVAGSLAGEDPESVRLGPADLVAAERELQERARRHHAAPAPGDLAGPIVSAGNGAPPAEAGALFRDVTGEVGAGFAHRSSPWLEAFRRKHLKTPPTFSGGGVAAEDVDGDGFPDLLFVGGGGNALLLGDGRGHFRDATAASGLDWRRPDGSPGEARQPLIADFDNDGLPDVFVSYANDDHRLYRNLGGGRFEDRTAGAGLGGRGAVGGPATTFDFDGDGLLDLYVGQFGDYLHGAIPTFDRDNRTALPNRLLRNRGDFVFQDVSEGSGSDDRGWTQAVSHVDFDRDGRPDLIVANDYGRNAFLRNLGGGRFEDRAPALGIHDAHHSMNVGVADLNDDAYPDIYVSNIAMLVKDDKYTFPDVNTPHHLDLRAMAGMLVKESDVLYLSHLEQGRLAAYAPSRDVERGPTSTGWAWDAEFFDLDHDGDDDLYLVNGTNDFNVFSMVYRRTGGEGPKREYLLDHRRESNVLFLNEGGRLRNVSPGSGADLAVNARSTAYLDFDGDGDLDVAINVFHGPARFLRNEAPKRGGWLGLRLVGDPARGSPRDAIGAHVRITPSEGRSVHRWVLGGSGYLSMNPKAIHVGLGPATSAEAEIEWPNGERQTVRGLEPGRVYVVRQGEVSARTPQALSRRAP